MKTTSKEVKGAFQYLDALRNSGVLNMYGARPYVQNNCGVTKEEATWYLSTWMKTYSKGTLTERIEKAMEIAEEVS